MTVNQSSDIYLCCDGGIYRDRKLHPQSQFWLCCPQSLARRPQTPTSLSMRYSWKVGCRKVDRPSPSWASIVTRASSAKVPI